MVAPAEASGGSHAVRHDAPTTPPVDPTATTAGPLDLLDDNGETLLTSTQVAISRPRHRIEKRAPLLWTIEGIWSWLILIALQVGWYFYRDNVMAFWNWAALYATIPFAFGSIVVAPWWRYLVARWDVSDSAVCSRTGWWTTHMRIAPLTRLQTVYTTRNLFERIFGLATVHASTASAHGSVEIRGLSPADADRLAEHLLAVTNLDDGDAT